MSVKKYVLSALFSLWLSFPLFSQQIQLPLTQRGEDGQFNQLIMATPVFAFRKDSVANPLDISAASAEDKVEWKKVIKPEMQLKRENVTYRAGYAWIFNGAAPGGFQQFHTLIAIENPGWTHFLTRIWTDRNNNLDLTDDGPPDTMTADKGIYLKLGSGANPYTLYLEHFPSDKFPLYNSLNDGEINKVRGNREFYGTSSSFREKRLNLLAGSWRNGKDSFSFAVKDVNCNGRYNDAGVDVAMMTDCHGKFDNLQGVVLEKENTYLEWGNAGYTLVSADAEGQYVTLLRDTAAKLKYSLNIGRKLPKFKYCTATKPQKHKSIRRLKGQYTYIYIWRDGAEEFGRDSAALHALGNSQSKQFRVLALNYGSSGRYVARYNNLYHTAVLQGFSNNDINRRLKIHKIPYGILVDKRQRIVATGLTPAQAKQWLSGLQDGSSPR